MNAKNHLPPQFYNYPHLASTVLTAQQLQETLLATEGWILSMGRVYNLVPKELGGGIFIVKTQLETFGT